MMINFGKWCFGVVCFICLLVVIRCSSQRFDDNLRYDISWNGPLTEQTEPGSHHERVMITTKDNEKYQCLIPQLKTEAEDFDIDFGPAPEVLLSDVLEATPKKCSYRLEPYWTYEVCHGQSVIQFHEEKDKDGGIKRDEYILGKMSNELLQELLKRASSDSSSNENKKKIPTKKIEGQETPYYSMEMTDGTPCDINGEPRKSYVLYVCHLSANNEVISVKEMTTCEYEIIVLSSVLCANPAYIVKKEPINDIQCHALPGHPSRPNSLIEQFNEDSLYRTSSTPRSSSEQKKALPPQETKPSNDESLNKNFLSGDYCLIGGTGWWSYEFCNGKFVQQFHVESSKAKTIIKLGYWNKQNHIKKVEEGVFVPKGKNHVMHYYTGGDICDLTGAPRTALVILTCIKGKGQQLSIYMSEPHPCQYTIGVESPILCPFVEKADKNGLFEQKKK
ncbi:endoplasmic reticulum lectin 1-like [Clytia hemisphaerica]